MDSATPRQPNPGERDLLERFARMEISLADLCRNLQGMLSVEFGLYQRRLTSHFLAAEPGIRIEKQHVQNALDRRRAGQISERDLSDWAAMLQLNDAYDWEGLDEEEIAQSLNELSVDWLLQNPKLESDR